MRPERRPLSCTLGARETGSSRARHGEFSREYGPPCPIRSGPIITVRTSALHPTSLAGARPENRTAYVLLGQPKSHARSATVRSDAAGGHRGTGIAAGSAALAGCLGEGSGLLNDASGGEGTHTVTMAPMGEVEFDGVPEDAFVTFPQ